MCLTKQEHITLSHHPINFCVYRSFGKGDKPFLICHVTCDSVIKGHMDLWVGAPNLKLTLCKA